MNEQWKDVIGFEDLYEVSNFGNVRSKYRIVYQLHKDGGQARHIYKGKMLKPQFNPNGYAIIDLHRSGTITRCLVHRLVALSFIENPDGKPCINHKDADPKNNRAENLEWCTQSENIQYAYDLGTKIPPHMRKVAQYDLDGNLIRLWNSQSEVERETGIFQANIYKVCSGKRNQAGWYVWRYIE